MVRLALSLALTLAAPLAGAAASDPAPAPDLSAPRPPPPDASPSGAAEPPLTREDGAGPSRPGLPRGAVLEEVSGIVRRVDRGAHTLGVETPAGEVTLSLDRNTMVYTAAGLATVLEVEPGVRIRAGRNADHLAYWVQVFGPSPAEAQSTPGQGTGPAGGGSAPAGESSGPGTGAVAPPAGPAGPPPGSASPGGPPAG